VESQRPVNLNLFTIKFPVTAIVSILHRLSGVFLFLAIPGVLWLLQVSLSSQAQFEGLHRYVARPWCKLLFLLVFAALIYHVIAGVRHLLMDAGLGESLRAGRWGAYLVLALTLFFVILAGICLW